ncbi:hypothetical protein D3C77_573400 [compost metagenome]
MVHDQQGQLEYISQARTSGFQRGAQVEQCLARLFGKVGRQRTGRVFTPLAGDVQQLGGGADLGYV